MSLLHATWLPAIRTPSSSGQPALLVWADTWRVATPEGPGLTPALHPFTLSHDDLKAWLSERNLLPSGSIDATACLTPTIAHYCLIFIGKPLDKFIYVTQRHYLFKFF